MDWLTEYIRKVTQTTSEHALEIASNLSTNEIIECIKQAKNGLKLDVPMMDGAHISKGNIFQNRNAETFSTEQTSLRECGGESKKSPFDVLNYAKTRMDDYHGVSSISIPKNKNNNGQSPLINNSNTRLPTSSRLEDLQKRASKKARTKRRYRTQLYESAGNETGKYRTNISNGLFEKKGSATSTICPMGIHDPDSLTSFFEVQKPINNTPPTTNNNMRRTIIKKTDLSPVTSIESFRNQQTKGKKDLIVRFSAGLSKTDLQVLEEDPNFQHQNIPYVSSQDRKMNYRPEQTASNHFNGDREEHEMLSKMSTSQNDLVEKINRVTFSDPLVVSRTSVLQIFKPQQKSILKKTNDAFCDWNSDPDKVVKKKKHTTNKPQSARGRSHLKRKLANGRRDSKVPRRSNSAPRKH